jgi:Na+-transporting methylmalonyl-CoA/oxaloacetate decarboxylase gamma subunit
MDFTHQQFGLEITVVGMGVVFLSLLLIVGAITVMKRLDERWQESERRHDEEAFGLPPTVDATTMVLISAAVATLLVGRSRIRSVRRLLPAEEPSSAWSVTGRTVLQGSHVVSVRGPRR